MHNSSAPTNIPVHITVPAKDTVVPNSSLDIADHRPIRRGWGPKSPGLFSRRNIINLPSPPNPVCLLNSIRCPPYRILQHTMAPALWVLSIPAGFVLCFSARLISLVLQIRSGVPLKNDYPRGQPESKEVAMKDTDG